MKRLIGTALGALILTGCMDAQNPLTGTTGDQQQLVLPPGTENPTPNSDVERYEAADGNGSGYAEDITYDPATDTFTVDNLAFDGDNTYSRDAVQRNLGPFQVYENKSTILDPVTGTPVFQFPHKAIYGESTSGNTRFAIVRTGAYLGYGFGGFVYGRTGSVTIPTAGVATFNGDYAGLRDFQGLNGMEYVTGDMTINIDFDDFNEGRGVSGQVTNRRYFDLAGNDITASYLAELGTASIPVLTFTVAPNVMDENGELTGGASSSYFDTVNGTVVEYESGNYYAMMSGEGANAEIVGIVVVTGENPLVDGSTFRETGGFIVYR